jgi:uridine kinase
VPSSDPRLVETVLAARRRLDRTTVVGISGIDCAGKSTLARGLAEKLEAGGAAAVVVGGDYFNRPRSERSPYPADDEDFGFAYGELVRDVLEPARAGRRVEATLRVKDWKRDVWDEQVFVVEPGAVVLVEGVFLFRPDVAPALDLKVWLELSFDEALARALVRDAEAMGGPDGVRERYATRYFPGQRRHLARDRPREQADVFVPAGS